MASIEEQYPRLVQRECRNPACPNPNTDPMKLKDCSRCHQACYCSKECQVANWKEHKVECKACVNQGAKLMAKQDQGPAAGRWVMGKERKQDLWNEWKASMPLHLIPPECRGDREEAMEILGVTRDLMTGIASRGLGSVDGTTRSIGRRYQL
ncbi:unnamed protein product [Cylindrotheca closterium]|uniref:MYND-type domain-containing protein n=1 Tax=Cylindrotheca closterium TaxID=2856 RepID=A0AAD2FQV1_9STRA|nr:unnamed protein product [Cylindrotheca closterium]